MKTGGKALRYKLALAVWVQAQADGVEESVERSLESVVRALRASPKLRQVLQHPGVRVEVRMDLLRRILQPNPVIAGLLQVMVEQRSLKLLAGVLRTYRSLRAVRSREVSATAVTATPLGRAEVERIKRVLERSLNKKVRLMVKTQKNVLGGLMIQVGERRLDGTLKGAFDRLERQLLSAT